MPFAILLLKLPAIQLGCTHGDDLVSLKQPRREISVNSETTVLIPVGFVVHCSTIIRHEPGISDGCSLLMVISSWQNAHTKQQMWLFCACVRHKKSKIVKDQVFSLHLVNVPFLFCTYMFYHDFLFVMYWRNDSMEYMLWRMSVAFSVKVSCAKTKSIK